ANGANVLDPGDADANVAPADGDVADAARADAGRPDAAPADAAPADATPADAAAVPPGCGDGFVTPPEQCDDHNTMAGDGCSPTCHWEPSTCAPGAQLAEL